MARRPATRPTVGLTPAALEEDLQRVAKLGADELRTLWRTTFRSAPPAAFSRDLLARGIIHRMQEQQYGTIEPAIRDLLARLARGQTAPARRLKPGSTIVRRYRGTMHEVIVIPDGFLWQGTVHASLSAIARAITGTAWNGPRFFGLRDQAAAGVPPHAGGDNAKAAPRSDAGSSEQRRAKA